ncbi:ATP-binding protein [Streptomyces sp. NPDC003660]
MVAGLSGTLISGVVAGSVIVVGTVAAHRVRTATRAVQQASARSAAEALGILGNAVAATDKVLRWSADQLCRGEQPPAPPDDTAHLSAGPAGEIERALDDLRVQVVAELIRVYDEAQASIFTEAVLNMAKRQHTLVSRALTSLSALENLTEDPYLLNTIYVTDHLTTRVRRHVESMAVIGGQSLRSVRHPVSVTAVLRGAASEVEKYTRVTVIAGAVGTQLGFPGHVGPNLTHLLAELIENALDVSAAETLVIVRAQRVAAGLAIEVEDRGIAMRPETRAENNALLRAPEVMELRSRVADGKIGLVTAALIAQRYGVSVELRENSLGGTTALVVVPDKCLVPLSPAPARQVPRAAVVPPRPHPAAAAAEPQEHSARRVPSPPLAPATGDSHLSGAPALPRRQRNSGEFRPPADAPPPAAPMPGMAAAFLRGSQAGAVQGERNT